MANQLSQNPIIFTGPLATSYKAAASLSFFNLRISKVEWKSPQAAGDTVRIVDPASGIKLLELTASASFSTQTSSLPTITQDWTTKPQMWSDFAVPQMDSGTLYIYLC